LTSTITQAPPQRKIASGPRDGVASMDLDRIAVPTLIVSHRHDRCGATPPAGIKKLKNRLTRAGKVEIVMLDGGYAPRSQPCQAKSQHGFFGIEAKAVDAIVKFIKANSH
jgi:pimeloyl-ACP methyl ester carboxylesterase